MDEMKWNNVTMIDINLIKPYWRNPRNNEAGIDALKESIERYGFNVPIVLDKDNVIIAGHSRYKACLRLGYTQIPCIIKADLTERQAKEYRIADNKIHEKAFWNEELLSKELMELGTVPGFEDDEVKAILDKYRMDEIKITDETIRNVEQKLNDKFKNLANLSLVGKIEFICPHCYKNFEIEKADVIKMLQ